ncbi:hypothetical protein KLP40_15065 [Hymenobacter sp. NST-14]|uniref:hypothetical protein n=1 Tax=Hymenobacter piscis TaxID=2839984 RepID=UPI001C01EE30|nr:hypothetical protein [Hymenobacter piscis]MBT9394491.1 hypothetical protein [Hymenobacter piscis]
MRSLLLHFLVSGLLLAGTSCSQEPVPTPGLRTVNGVPYYFFTEADAPWLQLAMGTVVWQFENARGQQRTYELYQRLEKQQMEERTVVPVGSFIGKSDLIKYYDDVLVRVRRTDSLGGGGEFHMYRGPALLASYPSQGTNPGTSQLYVEGTWTEFIGSTDPQSDYNRCRGIKFPMGDALAGPFQQLTVKGLTYPEVVELVATNRGPDCAPVPASYMRVLYYDRHAGIVRMVSDSGEVWDRLP